MSGHTKGPWAVHPMSARVVPAEHASRPIGAAVDATQDLATYAQEICLLHHPDRHRSEAEQQANARLIAAAPDLLEAGQALQAARKAQKLAPSVENLSRLRQASDAFDAAISRATEAQP